MQSRGSSHAILKWSHLAEQVIGRQILQAVCTSHHMLFMHWWLSFEAMPLLCLLAYDKIAQALKCVL